MDNHTDIVQVILAREVFICLIVLVLPEGAREGRAESGDPAIESKELLDGR